jgi:DNA-binding cell septation regulator SpoVG
MAAPTIRCEFRFVEAGKIQAFVDIHYGIFVMKDFKVIQNDDGELWVAAPSRSYRDRDGEQRWTDTIWIPQARDKASLQTEVLSAYQEAVRIEREGAQQDAARTATVRPDGSIALPEIDPDVGF